MREASALAELIARILNVEKVKDGGADYRVVVTDTAGNVGEVLYSPDDEQWVADEGYDSEILGARLRAEISPLPSPARLEKIRETSRRVMTAHDKTLRKLEDSGPWGELAGRLYPDRSREQPDPEVRKLLASAAEATEILSPDELEAFADKRRKELAHLSPETMILVLGKNLCGRRGIHHPGVLSHHDYPRDTYCRLPYQHEESCKPACCREALDMGLHHEDLPGGADLWAGTENPPDPNEVAACMATEFDVEVLDEERCEREKRGEEAEADEAFQNQRHESEFGVLTEDDGEVD